MPGPWEKYASTAESEHGPWEKYGTDNVVPIDRERQRNLTHYTSQGFPTREMMESNPLPGREDLRAAAGDFSRGDLMKAAHEGFTGASKAAGFAFGPATALTAPVATLTGMLGAGAGKTAGKVGGKLLGLSDDASDITGDVGEVAGGAFGGKFSKVISAGLKRLMQVKPDGRIGGAIEAFRTAGKTPKPATEVKSEPSRIVKPKTYRNRGERDSRDLGAFPGDKPPQPSPKGKLNAPEAGKSQTEASGQSEAIAKVLKKAGFSPHDALQLSDLEWKMIASTAGLKSVPPVEVFRDAVQSLK